MYDWGGRAQSTIPATMKRAFSRFVQFHLRNAKEIVQKIIKFTLVIVLCAVDSCGEFHTPTLARETALRIAL